jgi:SAM-dependent methyltransferase
MVSNKEIVAYLKSKSTNAGFIDTLKIRYRPLICPFRDLFPFVKEGDIVGDIGCGSGQFALLLNKFTPMKEVYGVEISKRLVKNARKLFASEPGRCPHRFEEYDGKHFPPDMRACNLFFLIDVLHHVPPADQQAFLNAIYALMRPGTKLILKDINGASPFVIFNKLHDLVFSGEIGKERSVRVAGEMARRAGFEIITTFTRLTAVYPHYVLVLEKSQE